ncbi:MULTISPECIES: HlyD family efflux transporter periplasmic adaptor subunit [unclassified Halomonas]|uniref:HlyD family efflux transporter periplasmic adaptor subunit n=1 Tax=unclassified Halomonas TaxID=2609666 RepID=UPI001C957981|nr:MULTISPECIES: HlyD family efflux transporter periplasmic adaptor subunit [unclassified Halomonas]MBY5926032.1 efflux RND transporter periplasmic adaptor subunit [Halomonas sp. DP4Y7-2]MBY6233074.1 efflux RND transporter periplasmic adaptor subunit [Halomonas sp. DP4Y7-1]
MSASETPRPASLPALVLALRDRAMTAATRTELAFSIANDSYPLLRFRQALVVERRSASKVQVHCVSGLATPKERTPFLNWVETLGVWLDQHYSPSEARLLLREQLDLPPSLAEGWAQWWPEVLWLVPLSPTDPATSRGPAGRAWALFLLEQAPPEPLRPQLAGLAHSWRYCWQALAPRRRALRLPRRRLWWLVLLAVVAILLLPVRLSALAPAEIISLDSTAITSPLDGVVADMLVEPNQAVDAGTPLLRLDRSELESRAEVLKRQLDVARAELDAAGNLAFDDRSRLADMTRLRGQQAQRQAELTAIEARLERTLVVAPAAGVAVYSDRDDWEGRPVTTGERILRLADPAQPAVEIQLAAADAIALAPGAEVTVFLSAQPLTPLKATLTRTSYATQPDADGIDAYRLLARLDDADTTPARLGLHGTAKVYGERVSLGYYLLRRPLATLRAWTGW